VAGSCEYGDEPSGSGATELVSYVFVYGLFNDAVSSSNSTLLNDRMTN
jgi:hypothetical protein